MSASGKGKQQKYIQQLQCQEQCIAHIPYYLSGLSRALFPTTFLEIAVHGGSAPRSPTPYLFIHHFWQKRTPSVCLLLTYGTLYHT